MFSRIVYRRQRGRRVLTVIAAFGLIAGSVLASGTVLAVHDTGLFQLDSDAQQATVPSGFLGPAGSEDWDNICNHNLGSGAYTPGALCYPAPGVTLPTGYHADKSTFISDAFNATSDNIYKGGTDDADINTWLWKQAGPSPNKADLETAFAAQYTGTAGTYAGHKVLFFGGDRFANNGDTNIGLWFFHNPVSVSGTNTAADGSCPVQSGCGFTGLHTVGNVSLGGNIPGDIFILSAFTGGGAEPTIKVFEWVGPGNATKNYLGSNGCFTSACTLQPLAIPTTPGFTDNRCDGATVTGDVACALVNAGEIQSPWIFQDQSSKSPANKIEANELYEGGLDLTGLGFGEACFSSMLLNTRSSQSGTSVLQDFALGGFGSCTSGMTTTPSQSSVSIGTGTASVSDQVTALTINGISTWAGNITFHLCGPIPSGTCDTGGVAIGSAIPVTNTTTLPITSASATVTSAGRYCWRGDFTATTNGVPNASDSSTGECFVVNPVTPSLSTQASGSVVAGGSLTDTATITGTAAQPGTNGPNATYPSINATNGAAAGGTIDWTASGPAGCLSAVTVTGTPKTVSGDGTYGPVSITTSTAGTYTFSASYSGNSPNTNSVPATGCPDTTGTETANAGSSSLVTTPSVGAAGISIGTGSASVTDSANLSVSGISPWSGSIAFHLCGPISSGTCDTGGVAIGSAISVNNTTSMPVTSIAATVTSVGRYCWRGDFTSSTTGVPNASDHSTGECFAVNPVTPTLATQASGTVTLGHAITDTATLTGTANQPGTNGPNATYPSINATNGAAAGGTITWSLFGPNDCTTPVTLTPTSATVAGDGTYGPVSATPTKLGTYTFVASYSGNSPNTNSVPASACPDTTGTETVVITGVSHLSTAQDWLPNDTATLTGDANLNGSLTFTLYNDGTCGHSSGTSQYTTTVTVTDAPSGSTFSTNNQTHKVTVSGSSSWSWLVHYVDNNLTSPSDSCESTTVNITN